jgi:L-asparagine transporter-like permease
MGKLQKRSILESCRSSSGTAMDYIQHVRYGWVRVIFATSINISVISMMTSFIGCVNIWIYQFELVFIVWPGFTRTTVLKSYTTYLNTPNNIKKMTICILIIAFIDNNKDYLPFHIHLNIIRTYKCSQSYNCMINK